MFTKIIDISLPLSKATIVYPGNVPVSIETYSKFAPGKSHLSKIIMGSHSGTHIDAPMHSLKNGGEVADFPIEAFIGHSRVLDFSDELIEITKESLQKKKIKKGERILAKTRNSEIGFAAFREDYIYLSGDGAEYLAKLGIALFAIDYISIKQKGSKDNRAHTALLSKNIPIVEGVDLKGVEEGEYFLSCLPIKFEGVDGSPCRAVLLK